MQTRKKQNVFSSLFFAVLLIALAINVNLVNEVNANPYGPNYQPPRDPTHIYIEVNGTVNPASAPIRREGNVYTLTGNIEGQPIWILCNDAVFDGAGYMLKSTESGYETGLTLNCTKNVTVKNVQVNGYYWGVTVKRLLYVDPAQQAEPDAPSSPYPESTDNTVTNCTVYNNSIGILVHYSENNKIVKNIVFDNSIGMQLESYSDKSTEGNLIKENQVNSNNEGILLKDCQANTVTSNYVTQNKVCGLILGGASNNALHANTISENEMGILVEASASNTITYNQFLRNNQWGIRLNGSQTENQIYANNFIDNNLDKGLQVSMPMYMHTGHNQEGKIYVEMLCGRHSTWNNASVGNYWSGYQTRYPNATENGGVWNTPFYINENNIDQHPLIDPLNLETPKIEEQQTNPNTQTPTPPYTLIIVIIVICIVAVILVWIYKNSKKLT